MSIESALFSHAIRVNSIPLHAFSHWRRQSLIVLRLNSLVLQRANGGQR